MDQELTSEILCDAYHPVSKTLVYIHSMETFIYANLKKACLCKDISKVETFGPYAKVMVEIIYYAFYRTPDEDY